MYEKILVCLDGSSLAEQILPCIEREIDCFKKIIFLLVVPTPEVNLPLGVPGAPGLTVHTDSMIKHFQEELGKSPDYLERMAQPLRDNGADVECVILEGTPGEAIVSYARDSEVGLIAVATHGLSGLRSVVVGSTAGYILKNSGLPVLMITPEKNQHAD